ncbi:hypothetical protein AL496_016410 [Enterococcus faecium]|nr:hypothetical protein AL496_016410 [Enterococcus faecium]
MFSLGYDSMTAILILFLSTQAGYVGSTINPFNVLIAQGVAGVYGNPCFGFGCYPGLSLLGFQLFSPCFMLAESKKNPLSSIVYESDLKVKHKFQNFDTEKEFQHKIN